MGFVNLVNPKLLSLESAVKVREKLRTAGKSLVLTNGVFDLLHTGHLYYLKQARDEGGSLFVAINGDSSVRALKGPSRPVQVETERAYALGALGFVDGIIVFHTPRLDAEIRALQPDVYCKAGDYTLETLDRSERNALKSVNSRIVFMPFLEGYSSTKLIARIKAAGSI